MSVCPVCEGRCEVYDIEPFAAQLAPCPACDGSGQVPDEWFADYDALEFGCDEPGCHNEAVAWHWQMRMYLCPKHWHGLLAEDELRAEAGFERADLERDS